MADAQASGACYGNIVIQECAEVSELADEQD